MALRCPQSEDVTVGALHLLPDDHLDAIARSKRSSLERALGGVVVA